MTQKPAIKSQAIIENKKLFTTQKNCPTTPIKSTPEVRLNEILAILRNSSEINAGGSNKQNRVFRFNANCADTNKNTGCPILAPLIVAI